MGYRVVEAANGIEVQQLAAGERRVDLLLAEFSALQERLRVHGAVLIEPERGTPFRRFFFRDPNGYVFEVVDADRIPER